MQRRFIGTHNETFFVIEKIFCPPQRNSSPYLCLINLVVALKNYIIYIGMKSFVVYDPWVANSTDRCQLRYKYMCIYVCACIVTLTYANVCVCEHSVRARSIQRATYEQIVPCMPRDPHRRPNFYNCWYRQININSRCFLTCHIIR